MNPEGLTCFVCVIKLFDKLNRNLLEKITMKKIGLVSFIVQSFFCLNIFAGEMLSDNILQKIERFVAKNNRIELVQPAEDKEITTLVLGMPGFNVKSSSFKFLLNAFSRLGMPGLLFNFDGCKEGESNDLMCFQNWEKSAEKAIVLSAQIAHELNLKLIIVGHSMGGLYAIHTLSAIENKNMLSKEELEKINLVLIAPADALKPLKATLQKSLGLLAAFLPDDNSELVNQIKQLHIPIEGFKLGTMICGGHAAQACLKISAFEGLVRPSKNLRYPTVPSLVVYHENDNLMNTRMYESYSAQFPSCTIMNLGTHANDVCAHTFEHYSFESNAEQLDILIGNILNALQKPNGNEERKLQELAEHISLD